MVGMMADLMVVRMAGYLVSQMVVKSAVSMVVTMA
jgi:hypothetical protein